MPPPPAAGVMLGPISLCGAARSFPAGRGRPHVVFRPTDLDIPTDRTVAILGGRGQGKTVLLALLAGQLRPDCGAVLRPAGLSPVINGGRWLHPGLTGLQNLRFLARIHGLQESRLLRAVDAFCGLGGLLGQRVRTLEGGARRSLEASVALVLPYGCYLLDDAQQLPPALLERCLAAARARGAGMIFTAAAAGAVNEHRGLAPDLILTIADATLCRLADAPGSAFAERLA